MLPQDLFGIFRMFFDEEVVKVGDFDRREKILWTDKAYRLEETMNLLGDSFVKKIATD